MNGRFLLDTAIAGLLSRDDPAVRQKLAPALEFFVPVFALAELEFGALYYQILHGTPKHINRYAAFLAAHGHRLLYTDLDTSIPRYLDTSIPRYLDTSIPRTSMPPLLRCSRRPASQCSPTTSGSPRWRSNMA